MQQTSNGGKCKLKRSACYNHPKFDLICHHCKIENAEFQKRSYTTTFVRLTLFHVVKM